MKLRYHSIIVPLDSANSKITIKSISFIMVFFQHRNRTKIIAKSIKTNLCANREKAVQVLVLIERIQLSTNLESRNLHCTANRKYKTALLALKQCRNSLDFCHISLILRLYITAWTSISSSKMQSPTLSTVYSRKMQPLKIPLTVDRRDIGASHTHVKK